MICVNLISILLKNRSKPSAWIRMQYKEGKKIEVSRGSRLGANLHSNLYTTRRISRTNIQNEYTPNTSFCRERIR